MEKKYILSLAFIAVAGSFGGLLCGFETGIISGVLVAIKDSWHITEQIQGYLVSAAMVGCFIGAFINGFLTDRLGRRKILGAIACIYLIGCFLCANSNNIYMLIPARILNGIACGMANSVIPMYLSEISPQKTRGFFVSLYQLSCTTGILIAFIISYIFSTSGNWHNMYYSGCIPAAILLVCFFFLSESPRWLVSKGRDEEAKAVFAKIEPEEEVEKSVADIKSTIQSDNETQGEKFVFKKYLVLPLVIGIGIMFAQICTGINVILSYATDIFKNAGFTDSSTASLITISIGLVNFLMTFVAMYLSDKVGRKPLLISGALIMAISMFALALAFSSHSAFLGDMQKWLAVGAVICFICSFAYSLGPVAWILVSEIFPLQAKGFLMMITVASNFIFNIIVLALFPVVKVQLGSSITFGIFGIVCVVSILFIMFFTPETKGISLEKIEENWKKGISPLKF